MHALFTTFSYFEARVSVYVTDCAYNIRMAPDHEHRSVHDEFCWFFFSNIVAGVFLQIAMARQPVQWEWNTSNASVCVVLVAWHNNITNDNNLFPLSHSFFCMSQASSEYLYFIFFTHTNRVCFLVADVLTIRVFLVTTNALGPIDWRIVILFCNILHFLRSRLFLIIVRIRNAMHHSNDK